MRVTAIVQWITLVAAAAHERVQPSNLTMPAPANATIAFLTVSPRSAKFAEPHKVTVQICTHSHLHVDQHHSP
jgi:hypothetical protein